MNYLSVERVLGIIHVFYQLSDLLSLQCGLRFNGKIAGNPFKPMFRFYTIRKYQRIRFSDSVRRYRKGT